MTLIGHWASLQEAEKLTDQVLIGGLIQEYVKRGGLLSLSSPGLPVAQFNGLDVMWNREKDVPTAASVPNLGNTTVWQSGQNFDRLTRRLGSIELATYLDNFIPEIWSTHNDYAATQLMANKRAMIERIENMLIYGHRSTSPGNLEFDGLHTIAARYRQNYHKMNLHFDAGNAALKLSTLRELIDNMRHGVDYLIMSPILARRFDAMVEEQGIVNATSNANIIARVQTSRDSLGNRVTMYDSIPIIRNDWMGMEGDGTGLTDATRRTQVTSGGNYSILAVKFGNVYETQPGLTFLWGNNGGSRGELWKTTAFEKMEDRDARGLRHNGHYAVADGSTMAIGCIVDIANSPIAA